MHTVAPPGLPGNGPAGRNLIGKLVLLRRVTALVVFLFSVGSNMEAMMGELRDGEVHHESGLLAAQHATMTDGDHGHEDLSGTRHGTPHQHGTGADHCTHQHGVALPALPADVPSAQPTAVSFPEPVCHARRLTVPLFHPPRA